MSEFKWIDIESFIFPNPTDRVENPKETVLQRGDFVRAKIGPAFGKIGVVVVERNGNYLDYLDEVGEEKIGVGFAEGNDLNNQLIELVKAGIIPKIRTVTRWFDSADQLEVVASTRQNK